MSFTDVTRKPPRVDIASQEEREAAEQVRAAKREADAQAKAEREKLKEEQVEEYLGQASPTKNHLRRFQQTKPHEFTLDEEEEPAHIPEEVDARLMFDFHGSHGKHASDLPYRLQGDPHFEYTAFSRST